MQSKANLSAADSSGVSGSGVASPCPFCGGPIAYGYEGSHDWAFECQAAHTVCGARTVFYISHVGDEHARALAAWNHRAKKQPTEAG